MLVASNAVCFLAVGLILLYDIFPQRPGDQDEHMFSDVCAFSISLLLTSQLESWLNGCSPIELLTTYLGLFAMLEVARSDAWTQLLFAAPEPAPTGAGAAAAEKTKKPTQTMLLIAQGMAGVGVPFFDLEAEFESLQLW